MTKGDKFRVILKGDLRRSFLLSTIAVAWALKRMDPIPGNLPQYLPRYTREQHDYNSLDFWILRLVRYLNQLQPRRLAIRLFAQVDDY